MRKALAWFLVTVTAAGIAAAQNTSATRAAPGVQPPPQQRQGSDPGRTPQRVKLTATKLGAVVAVASVSNPRAAQAQTAMNALLQKQYQSAQVEAEQIVKSSTLKSPVQIGGSRTMSAGDRSTPTGIQPTSAATLNSPRGVASGPGLGSLASNLPSAVLTCTNDPTFRILHVSGGTAAATFTQQQGVNFYTITGCSLGDPGINAKVFVYSGGNFRLDFQVEEWSDSGIKMRVDPGLRGVSDQDNLTLVLQRNDGKQTAKSGFRFYAAREKVALDRFPKADFSLNKFTPTKTSDLSPQYSSPSSREVEPNIPGYTAGVSWACSDCDYNRDHPNFSYYTPQGEDIYSFKELQPGFVPTDASMVYADLQCPSGPLHKEGSFGVRWVGDDLHVQWQGQTCTTNGCGGFGQPDCFISPPGSNYAVKLWVEGPRGIDPWSGKPR